jgi:hypothetical protein
MKTNKSILALTCFICCSTLMSPYIHAHNDKDKTTGENANVKSSIKETVDNALSE